MTAWIRVIAVALTSLFVLGSAAGADRKADEAAIRELKETLWPKAYFEQDAALLDRILAPEFLMVDDSGAWSTKAAELAWVAKNKPGYDSLTFYLGHYQSTNVLLKRNGQWRAVASHVSGYKKIE
jgi:hypothetical protein